MVCKSKEFNLKRMQNNDQQNLILMIQMKKSPLLVLSSMFIKDHIYQAG